MGNISLKFYYNDSTVEFYRDSKWKLQLKMPVGIHANRTFWPKPIFLGCPIDALCSIVYDVTL